jgi:hypothetical protein
MNNCPRCGSSNYTVEEGRTSRLLKKPYNIAFEYREGGGNLFLIEVLIFSIFGAIILYLAVSDFRKYLSPIALFFILLPFIIIIWGWDTWVVHISAKKMICKDCKLNWIAITNRPWPTAEEAMQQHLVIIGEKTPVELAREEKLRNKKTKI